MKAQTITLIGLDRVGGSIALALRGSELGLRIIGHDEDGAVLQTAQTLGMVDEGQARITRAAAAGDIVVLNLPLHRLELALGEIGPVVQEHTVILDLAALKRPAYAWARQQLQRGYYVSVLPVLAAAELVESRIDLEAAHADLFRDSIFCLMPAADTNPNALETAIVFGRMLGGTPFFIDPAEYDSLVGGLETLPGLLAAAVFQTAVQARGWRDMLRFAGLPFFLSTQALRKDEIPVLAFEEKASTLRWLDGLMAELGALRRIVANDDRERLLALWEQLETQRQIWLRERAENDWEEIDSSSLMAARSSFNLFGRLGRGQDQD